jgi:site-specific DNA-methyltransferase (adenine-specific)
MLELNKIYLGDCLQVMKDILDKTIDAIITDPPYGTTACKWDSVIPFEPMWEQLNRIIKPNGAIVLFGSEPFSSALRMSNIKNYKYDWVWNKVLPANIMQAKYQPMKIHENIIIFCKNKNKYYPIKTIAKKKNIRPVSNKKTNSNHYGCKISNNKCDTKTRFPKSIIEFNNRMGECNSLHKFHPTQKPVALIEYLIKTYTLENETVLDFTIGSGTTAVACINTGRNFIGIEKEEKYYDIANKRIKDTLGQQTTAIIQNG